MKSRNNEELFPNFRKILTFDANISTKYIFYFNNYIVILRHKAFLVHYFILLMYLNMMSHTYYLQLVLRVARTSLCFCQVSYVQQSLSEASQYRENES